MASIDAARRVRALVTGLAACLAWVAIAGTATGAALPVGARSASTGEADPHATRPRAAAAGASLPADPGAAPAEALATEPLRLVLNLPAYRIDVYEFGELTRSYPVAIGMPRYRTPRGTYRITSIEWNPWWHPPASPWARGEKPVPPGPRNPMGRAKLYFRELYYIHGTPEVSSIGTPASHGCVRMLNEDVVELARLVHRYASPDLTAEEVAALGAAPGPTRRIRLRRPVPLEIRYDVVEAHGGMLQVHHDVYRLASRAGIRERVMQVLRAAGHDASTLDRAGLEEVMRGAERGSLSIPIAWLVSGGGAAGFPAERAAGVRADGAGARRGAGDGLLGVPVDERAPGAPEPRAGGAPDASGERLHGVPAEPPDGGVPPEG